MIAPALGIIWTVSGIVGSVVTWVILLAYANSVGIWWGPMLFASAVTALELVFVLGNIWGLDGARTPRNFCIAQIGSFTFLALVITSICAMLSWVTTTSILWPNVGSTLHILRWRWWYMFPLAVWPTTVAVIQIVLLSQSDTVQFSTNGFHCDIDSPLWLKLIGFPAAPAVLAIPSSLFFGWAMHRIAKMYKAHRQLAQNVLKNHRYNNPNPKSSTANMSNLNSRAIAPPHPNRPMDENWNDNNLTKDFNGETRDPLVNTVLPPTINQIPQLPAVAHPSYPPTNVIPHAYFSMHESKSQTDSNVRYDEYRQSDMSSFSGVALASAKESACPARASSLRSQTHSVAVSSINHQPESFLSGIWRLLFFQGMYLGIVVLLSITTLNSMVQKTPTPAFGTDYVCLLLAAWAAVIVFGHAPGVRKEIKLWITRHLA